jgi:diguanylate cyclase (GGDEF)-like protein/PAS domain S-box-containing protein
MIAVAAAIVILGIVVLARERPSGISLSFFGLTISVSTWLIGIGLVYMSKDAATATLFSRFAYIGVATIPAAVLHFTLALLDEIDKRRVALSASWAASLVFVFLFTQTNALLDGVWHYWWGFYPRLSPATAIFLVYFGAALGWSLLLLALKETTTDQEGRRNVAFFTALAVGYVGSIDYLAAFGLAIYPIGFVSILGFMILASRAVMRFRLTDLSATFIADQMLQTVHGGVIVIDLNGRVRLVNATAGEILGYPVTEMRGRDLREILGTTFLPSTDSESYIRRFVSRNRPSAWRRKDGSEVELSVSASALRDHDGEQIGLLYAISDLADKRRADRNEFSATHDMLTRLPNRARFAQSFEEIKLQVQTTARVAGVFFLDLDGFKSVNDRYGHATGDALLQIVASRLRNAVRGDDVIVRHGGDEFVLLLNLARIADGSIVADKLLRVIGEPYAIDDRRVTVTASIGASFYPRDGAAIDDLIRAADAAMYDAKKGGKARLHVTAPPRTDVPARPPFGIDARA